MTTRAERLTEYLNTYRAAWDRPQAVAEILAIADDRQYASLTDFARMIDRNMTTIASWRNRGQHDIPAPIGSTGKGDIWDVDDIKVWGVHHPKLVGPDHLLFKD